jgi:hypothetical protein
MVMNFTYTVAPRNWEVGASRNVGHLSDHCVTQLSLCQHGIGSRKTKILGVLYIDIPDPRPNPWSIAISTENVSTHHNNCNGCCMVSEIVTERELYWRLSERELFYICFEDFILCAMKWLSYGLFWMGFVSVGCEQANVCVGLDG